MEQKAQKSKAIHLERERKRQLEELRIARMEMHATSKTNDTEFGKLISSASRPEKISDIVNGQDSNKYTPALINAELVPRSPNSEPLRESTVLPSSPVQSTPTSLPEKTPESTQSFISNMQKEVQLMMRLDHPNIVKIYQVLETDDECFVVMEYAKGGELMDYIAARGYLTEKEARKFFRQIVSALDHCHLASVVHRDLKLENLLISQERNVLISDFGLGRTFNPDVQEYMKTFCGTPNYAAAELVSGIPYVGVKADIWAMGVVLYIMMTGRAPFQGETISLLYRHIKAVEYHIPNYFSPSLCDLLSKILVRDPVARIDMEGIRSHPWINAEFTEQPLRIVPAVSGVVNSATLAQVISSIYYDKTYVVYVFRRHGKQENNDKGTKSTTTAKLLRLSINTGAPVTHMRRSSIQSDATKEEFVRRKSISFENTLTSPTSPGIKKGLGTQLEIPLHFNKVVPNDICKKTIPENLPPLPNSETITKSHSTVRTGLNQLNSSCNSINSQPSDTQKTSIQEQPIPEISALHTNPEVQRYRPVDTRTSSKRSRRMSLQDAVRVPTEYSIHLTELGLQESNHPSTPNYESCVNSSSFSPISSEDEFKLSPIVNFTKESIPEKIPEELQSVPESNRAVRVVGRKRSMTANALSAICTTVPLNDIQNNVTMRSNVNTNYSQELDTDKSSTFKLFMFNRSKGPTSPNALTALFSSSSSTTSNTALRSIQTNPKSMVRRQSYNENNRAIDVMRRMSAISPLPTTSVTFDDRIQLQTHITKIAEPPYIEEISQLKSDAHDLNPGSPNSATRLSSCFRTAGLSPSAGGAVGSKASNIPTVTVEYDPSMPTQLKAVGIAQKETLNSNASCTVSPKPVQEIQLSMEEIEEWHIMHKSAKEVRTMRFVFNKATTSAILSPAFMFQDIHRALIFLSRIYNNQIKFTRAQDHYIFKCEYRDQQYPDMTLDFEVEICKVWLLNLHGMRMKRIAGNVFLFKEFYTQLINEVHWE
ncbi:hypothetical protein MT418_001128 [Batrachochytrium dendrobatidis]